MYNTFLLECLTLNIKVNEHPKHQELFVQQHSVTSQKTCMFSTNTVRTSNLAYVICLDLLLETVVVTCWLYQCQQALRCVTVIFMTFLNVQVALGLQQFVLWRFTVTTVLKKIRLGGEKKLQKFSKMHNYKCRI